MRLYLLILVFIGITLVRKIFLNRVDAIWSENIPKTSSVLKIIDYIELNRRDYKFDVEELYYYYLIDTFRSMKLIEEKTGSMTVLANRIFMKQQKTRYEGN